MSLARPADRIRARALRARMARCPWVDVSASPAGPAAGPPAAAPVVDLATGGVPPRPGSDPGETAGETATRDSI